MKTNEISQNTNPRMNRIQKASKFVRTVLLAALILQGAGFVLGFPAIVLPYVFHLFAHAFPSQAGYTNCSSVLALPFAFMLTLYFFRLFSRFKEGRLFDAQTVGYLETAGKWWIVLGVVQIILQSVGACVFHPLDITISGNGIVAGLIVFFVGWVFREAQELQEEQELIV